MLHRLAGTAGRLLLLAVFTLQVIWFDEAWYWASLTMVIGVLTLERLREELTAVLEVCAGASGEEQEGDQGQCGQERLG